jgi:hypothetical protein
MTDLHYLQFLIELTDEQFDRLTRRVLRLAKAQEGVATSTRPKGEEPVVDFPEGTAHLSATGAHSVISHTQPVEEGTSFDQRKARVEEIAKEQPQEWVNLRYSPLLNQFFNGDTGDRIILPHERDSHSEASLVDATTPEEVAHNVRELRARGEAEFGDPDHWDVAPEHQGPVG